MDSRAVLTVAARPDARSRQAVQRSARSARTPRTRPGTDTAAEPSPEVAERAVRRPDSAGAGTRAAPRPGREGVQRSVPSSARSPARPDGDAERRGVPTRGSVAAGARVHSTPDWAAAGTAAAGTAGFAAAALPPSRDANAGAAPIGAGAGSFRTAGQGKPAQEPEPVLEPELASVQARPAQRPEALPARGAPAAAETRSACCARPAWDVPAACLHPMTTPTHPTLSALRPGRRAT